MSNLASIQKIKKIYKHPNADRLNIVEVLGWNCVTAESYSNGDLVIYIQIDTLVPRATWSEFLFKNEKPDATTARIKSIRLRSALSQGLILPIKLLPEGVIPSEGLDVTDILSVTKYDKPLPKDLNAAGHFASNLTTVTDEPNWQNHPDIINEFKGKQVYITKKMDGQSGTFIKQDGVLRVFSRRLELKDGNNNYWNMARKYDLANKMNDGQVQQSEVYGPSIQQNKMGAKEVSLAMFNIGNTNKQYLGLKELKEASVQFGVPMPEIIYEGEFKWDSMEELLALADEQKYDNGAQCEGIVIRPVEETRSQVLRDRMSIKVVSNKFRLLHGE